MKQKTTHYICIIIFLFFSKGINSQSLTLNITSTNKNEVKILDQINFIKKHKDLKSLEKEKQQITNYLKTIGYFTNKIDSVKKIKNNFIVFYNLNKRTTHAVIKFNEKSKIYNDLNYTGKNIVKIPIKQLQPFLKAISKKLDSKGKSFSKTQLKNIQIKKDTLFANIEVLETKKRTIDKIIIKDYNEFPANYIYNYFNLNKGALIQKNKINDIHKYSKKLNFIDVIKPPEILFLKDSTLLYLYFKKKQNNSFDGLINFNSSENGKLKLNGNLNLNLINIINKGESFNLNWVNTSNKQQNFEFSTKTPYIFNSKLSPDLSFSIFKQDSSFISTKFKSTLNYHLNRKSEIGLTFDIENSEKLINSTNQSTETFRSDFLGIQYTLKIPKNDLFNNNKIKVEIQSSIGKRTINAKSTNQIKINAISSYIFELNKSNEIFIQNSFGYLNSDNLIQNELFRIGGLKTIRGIHQYQILTNQYNLINLEYRHLPTKTSYLYTITDIGLAKINTKNNKFTTIGLGYFFSTKKSTINLSLSSEVNYKQTTDIKSLTLNINWINHF